MSPRVNKVIDELGETKFAHPISIRPEVGEILYALARNARPKVIVEIGAFIGVSAIYFAQAMEDNDEPSGKVYSIDLFEPHPESPLLPFRIENPLEIAADNVKRAGLEHRVSFIKGNSYSVAARLLPTLDGIDILFIDGDHTYKGALRDYNTFHAAVRKGGLIVFHDIHPEECAWWGPRIVLDSLKRTLFFKRYNILEVNTPDGFGLAICEKLRDGRADIRDNFLL